MKVIKNDIFGCAKSKHLPARHSSSGLYYRRNPRNRNRWDSKNKESNKERGDFQGDCEGKFENSALQRIGEEIDHLGAGKKAQEANIEKMKITEYVL